MYRTIFIVLGFLLVGIRAKAQEIDPAWEFKLLDNPGAERERLEAELEKIDRVQNPRDWVQLFWKFMQTYDGRAVPEHKADFYASEVKEALRLSQQMELGGASKDLERILLRVRQFQSEEDPIALGIAYKRALEERSWDVWPLYKANLFNDFGLYLDSHGQSTSSLKIFEQATSYLKQHNLLASRMSWLIPSYVAFVLDNQDRTDQALEGYLFLENQCQARTPRYFCFSIYYGLSGLYSREEESSAKDKAQSFLQKAEKLAKSLNTPEELGTVFYGWLNLYRHRGEDENALKSGEKALIFFQQAGVLDFTTFTLYRIASLQQKTKKFAEASSTVEVALKNLGNKDYQNIKRDLYFLSYNLNKQQGFIDKALHSLELYNEDLERSHHQQNEADFARAAASLGLDREERKTQALSEEIEQQKTLQIALGCMLVISFIAIGLGINNQRKSLQVIREQQKTKGIMRQIQLGIVILDGELKIRGEYSQAMHVRLDYEPSLQGLSFFELLDSRLPAEHSLSAFVPKLKQCIGKNFSESEEVVKSLPSQLLINHSAGKRHLTLEWQALVGRNQKVEQFLVLLRDVTDEEELREAFEIQNEKLLTLGTLTASIAHDIASPSQLIAQSEEEVRQQTKATQEILSALFADASEAEAQTLWTQLKQKFSATLEASDAIRLSVNRIISIQTAIRNQSREDHDIQLFPLLELVEESLTLTHSFVKKTLRVSLEIPADLSVYGHRSQLGQVLTNLLNNAGDAVVEKGEEVKEAPLHIRVRLTDEEEYWVLRVEDAGKGIPEHLREKIFQPFFTTKGVGKGTGLGLPICAKIIKAHEGILLVEASPELGGACFTIKLLKTPHSLSLKSA